MNNRRYKVTLAFLFIGVLLTIKNACAINPVDLDSIDCSANSVSLDITRTDIFVQGANKDQSSDQVRACRLRSSEWDHCAQKIVRALVGVKELYAIGGPVKRCIYNSRKRIPGGMNRKEWYRKTNGTCKVANWTDTAAKSAWEVGKTPAQIRTYDSSPSSHSTGRGIDIYVNKKIAPVNKCKEAGDAIKDWALAEKDNYSIDEIIWNENIYTRAGNWAETSFTSKKHWDHVHLTCKALSGTELQDEKRESKAICNGTAAPEPDDISNLNEEISPAEQEDEPTQVEAEVEDVDYAQKLKELLAAMSGKEPDDVVEGDDDETVDDQIVDEDQTSEKDELVESSSVSKNIDETKLGTLCDNLHKIKKEITSEDVNWLAKMLHGETAGKPNKNEASAMLWSLVQGQSTLIVHRKKGLGDYAQLYSQPINTLWLKKGRRCKTSYTNGKFNGLKNACSKTKVDRRVKYRNLAWDKISPVARNAAIAFSEGADSNNFIGSSGWYAKGLWKKREQNGANKTDKKVFFKEIDKNVFYATKRKKLDSTTWDGTEITIIDSSTICPYEEEPEKKATEKKEVNSDGLIDPFKQEE